MSSNIFNINYRRLISWLLPVDLRMPVMMAWLYALVSPVILLYNFFLINRRSNLYKLQITPQVCYIETLLNDRYDSLQRRIRLAKSFSYEPIYIFKKEESKPVHCYRGSEAGKPKRYLYLKGETRLFSFDFIVLVPSSISFEMAEMTAIIDSYILPDKVYKIQPL